MTREEAIAMLKSKMDGSVDTSYEWAETVRMAIEALKNVQNCVHCEHYTEVETDTGIHGECKIDTAHRGDLISRQDAVKPFCVTPDGTRIPEVDCDNFPVEFSVESIKKHLLSLPSAEQKTGEWDDIGGVIRWGCPFCHHAYESRSNFCPNCGARMLGEDGEEE